MMSATDTTSHALVEPAVQPLPPELAPQSGLTTPSLQARIQAARAAKQVARTVELPIPGYKRGGVDLRVTYRGLTYSETKAIEKQGRLGVAGEDTAELYAAASILAAAAVSTVAVIDGERHPVPTLGIALAKYLDPTSAADSQRQAVFEVFDDELLVMTTFAEYGQWRAGEDDQIGREVAGNSNAAGSSS